MAIKIAARFSTTCATVFNNNYDTCGSLTRSSIESLTPATLENMFVSGGLYADLQAWFKTSFEMKACGVDTNGMYDWIMSGADRTMGRSLLSIQKVQGNPSLLFPFILGKQESVLNTDFWAVAGGSANSAYTGDTPASPVGTTTAGPLTAAQKALGAAADRVIRVVSRYGIELDPKWFTDRKVVHVFTRTAGVAEDGAWRVLASATSTNLGYVDVLVTSQNAGSTQPFAAAPVNGVLVEGVNNVNDFERWCNNMPNYDGRKMVPFWVQTIRRSRCVDQPYREYFKRLNTEGVNEAWQQFGDIDLAKRNAQDETNYQKAFVNAFFYNKPWDANQTTALWKSLPQILTPSGFAIDPGTGGKLIAYRANFVGVKEQLFQCGRVKDLANQPLNMASFLQDIYGIKRARESQGRKVTDIDVYTDSVSASDFMSGYITYANAVYGTGFRLTREIPQGSNPQLGFLWDTYRFKYPAGVNVNIIQHNFFDDYRSAMLAEGMESRGILLLILDMGKPGPKGGTIYWSNLANNRVTHSVGDLDKLGNMTSDWACVMESITKEVVMTSETGTAVVECPMNSMWYTNIAPGAPVMAALAAQDPSAAIQYTPGPEIEPLRVRDRDTEHEPS